MRYLNLCHENGSAPIILNRLRCKDYQIISQGELSILFKLHWGGTNHSKTMTERAPLCGEIKL